MEALHRVCGRQPKASISVWVHHSSSTFSLHACLSGYTVLLVSFHVQYLEAHSLTGLEFDSSLPLSFPGGPKREESLSPHNYPLGFQTTSPP